MNNAPSFAARTMHWLHLLTCSVTAALCIVFVASLLLR